MTAARVIARHADLLGVGSLSHAGLDDHVTGSTFVIVSGSASYMARRITGSDGIDIVDGGPGGDLVISANMAFLSASATDGHQGLRQLIHFIDDGPTAGFPTTCFKETLPFGSPFPTEYIWWDSPARERKIVQLEVTRSLALPLVEVWKMFDDAGTAVVEQVRDRIFYAGPFETYRSRSIG